MIDLMFNFSINNSLILGILDIIKGCILFATSVILYIFKDNIPLDIIILFILVLCSLGFEIFMQGLNIFI